MAAVEPDGEELAVVRADAGERLSSRSGRLGSVFVVVVVVAVQAAWVGAFGYLAYRLL
jgi:hypothetical protein